MARVPKWSGTLVAAWLWAGPWIGQQSGEPATPAQDYRTIVESYRETGATSSVQAVRTASPRVLNSWIDLATSDRTGAWEWQMLRAAAILHTEVWYDDLLNGRPDEAARQLETALRLFVRVRDVEPRQIEFIHRWLAVVGSILPRLSNIATTAAFSKRTSETLPLDDSRQSALRDYQSGLRAERQGTQAGYARAPGIPGGPTRQWWAAAARSYQTALETDPTFELAALHLGRVRMLQGQLPAAAKHFERAAEGDDARVRYLARLFSGSLHERRGRFEEAAQAYARAVREYPYGQSAPIALSQLFSRTGREPDARRLIAQLANRKGLVEPLWTYLPPPQLSTFDAQMAFDELRVEVLR